MKDKFKILFVVIILGSSRTSYSKNMTSDSLILGVACYNQVLNDEADLKFVLSITNKKQQSITIPSKFEAVPKNGKAGNIGYEVVFMGANDSINYTDQIVANYDGKIRYPATISVESSTSYLFQVQLHPIYFSNAGLYRLRFYLKSEAFKPLVSDHVYTDWIIIKVANNNIWPESKTGNKPIFRNRITN